MLQHITLTFISTQGARKRKSRIERIGRDDVLVDNTPVADPNAPDKVQPRAGMRQVLTCL
jgi:hypothetical protein